SASPQLQRVLLPLIAASGKRLEGLAQQLDSGQLAPGQFGVAELTKLVDRASGETKTKLQQQLSRISNSNRAQVVEQYKPCLEIEPDVPRGAELFRKHCASCHRVGDIGVDVGPNISDSRTKKPLELLTAILDPNLAIDNNFFRFVVLTEDGRVVEGIIAEETADALVIRGQDDRRELIRREDIATMKATGVSLMPEGLEAQIDPQAMADLIGFIKGWRYMDGSIPVN
ncbi:MAG: c-type cytochrome, partial [Planctomycetales bacterium]|nr:c-type cytochrome [Planctomycetales bacterium]